MEKIKMWITGFFLIVTFSGEGQNLPKKVLFVGNSYTYFWNLPQHVSEMATSSGTELQTFQSTAGGSNWGHHWRGERNLETRSLLETEDYDIVVLQNHSMRPTIAKDSMMHYGDFFAELISESGAEIYLYQTWAREWDPYMQREISAAYNELAKAIGAQIVPVGEAWKRARQLRPDIRIYDEDGSHPSPLGTYLTSCVFYRVITKNPSIGMPHRLITTDAHGEKLYLNILSEGDASFLQKVADEIVNEMNGRQ